MKMGLKNRIAKAAVDRLEIEIAQLYYIRMISGFKYSSIINAK